jgi:hypothetical protein
MHSWVGSFDVTWTTSCRSGRGKVLAKHIKIIIANDNTFRIRGDNKRKRNDFIHKDSWFAWADSTIHQGSRKLFALFNFVLTWAISGAANQCTHASSDGFSDSFWTTCQLQAWLIITLHGIQPCFHAVISFFISVFLICFRSLCTTRNVF